MLFLAYVYLQGAPCPLQIWGPLLVGVEPLRDAYVTQPGPLGYF